MNLCEGVNNSLKEEKFEQRVELNGMKLTLYSKDEADWFEAIKRTISGLENYATDFRINTTIGTPYAEVIFGTSVEKSAFKVIFDVELFGKVKAIQTTFSNLTVDSDFVRLAQELYNLYK